MSDSTNYRLVITGADDVEYAMFKLLKAIPRAKDYIDDDGKSVGNGYDWRSLKQDVRAFSVSLPNVLFQVIEYGTYDSDSFEYRYYFKGGRLAKLSPEVTVRWPEFNEDMLA